MTTATALATEFARAGRTCYERDGRTLPVIAFHRDDRQIICGIEFTDTHPVDVFAKVAYLMTKPSRAEFIVLVAEGWSKAYDMDADVPKLQRGELYRMHEDGDAAVRTTVMCLALDLKDVSESHSVHSTVLSPEGAKKVKWDIHENHGRQAGAMTDDVLAGAAAMDDEIAEQGDWEMALAAAGTLGLLREVSVLGEED